MSVQEGRNTDLSSSDSFHERTLSKGVVCSQLHEKMLYEHKVVYFESPLYGIGPGMLSVGQLL